MLRTLNIETDEADEKFYRISMNSFNSGLTLLQTVVIGCEAYVDNDANDRAFAHSLFVKLCAYFDWLKNEANPPAPDRTEGQA